MLPRRTWLNVPIREGDSEDETAEWGRHVRGLVEVVAQLSHSPAFKWVGCYDAFWKHTLISKIDSCAGISWGDRRLGTEYDCYEQLEATSAPRFMLDFSRSAFSERHFEMLVELLVATPARVLKEPVRDALSKLTADDLPESYSKTLPIIEIGISLPDSGVTGSMLSKLHRVLNDIISHDKRDEASISFDITAIRIPGSVLSDAIKIEALTDVIASQKIKIRHLFIGSDAKLSVESASVQAFQALLYRALPVKSLSGSLSCL